jgi:preprotein translocase subunit YajC
MAALVLLAVTFLLMWGLFILPQQRRVKAHREFVATVAAGDEVITTSGLLGTVVEVDGDVVSLEVAEGVVVRFARGAIAARPGDEPAAPAPALPSGTAADRAVEDRPVTPDPEPTSAES